MYVFLQPQNYPALNIQITKIEIPLARGYLLSLHKFHFLSSKAQFLEQMMANNIKYTKVSLRTRIREGKSMTLKQFCMVC